LPQTVADFNGEGQRLGPEAGGVEDFVDFIRLRDQER
jgi:hypothetical protein